MDISVWSTVKWAVVLGGIALVLLLMTPLFRVLAGGIGILDGITAGIDDLVEDAFGGKPGVCVASSDPAHIQKCTDAYPSCGEDRVGYVCDSDPSICCGCGGECPPHGGNPTVQAFLFGLLALSGLGLIAWGISKVTSRRNAAQLRVAIETAGSEQLRVLSEDAHSKLVEVESENARNALDSEELTKMHEERQRAIELRNEIERYETAKAEGRSTHMTEEERMAREAEARAAEERMIEHGSRAIEEFHAGGRL